MQIVCQFTPGNKLSREDINRLMLPDECVGQLSRLSDPKDIIRQLPQALLSSLSTMAQKDSQRLVAEIKPRLVRAEWVALSMLPRRLALSEAQLQAYPALRKRVEQCESQQPKKFIKANYKAVLDDVPLARNLTFTPVEPSPDKKIVVEFAGQWPDNAAYLMLGKGEEQKSATAKPRQDGNNDHRSLVTFKNLEDGPRDLYLAIPMVGFTQPLKLKLAEQVVPVEEKHEMGEWENVLVPVRPLAYLDGSKDKAKASELKGGFLYLFWKGKLWRELAITDSAYYQDIDVEYHRALHQQEQQNEQPKHLKREPDGYPLPHLWLPYKILGEVQQGESGLKVMFSPKQQRFSQIEALESDSAKLAQNSTSLDELSSYSDAQAFSAKESTSDVDSATVHSITEDDMPWLTDKTLLVRSYDQSNTAIAYVDGKNNGFLFRVDVGTSGMTATNTLYVIDHNKNANEVYELEHFQGKQHDWQQVLLTDLSPQGVFTFSLVCDDDPDSRHVLFDQVPYQDLFIPPESAQALEKAQPRVTRDAGFTSEEQARFESLVMDW
ncbi:hypothetical protein ACODM8_14015 [Vibrio ostreicida]|uniref:Uncharacterized protein n=1 Tax=Vibrio ostreicida TaxID=526588 RepID=A0ABT8BVX9_9VIBR|nr:hypothetical protein [Vibrio ostreicida]MDN3610252.1 hypothetical protein [Vibrio ostreicida]NPD07731.1 hypothetical protein [Vibrio ostreicida]